MSRPDARVFRDAAARVTRWRHPLLVSHARPDGDALGALAAMRSLLRLNSADPLALLFDPVPRRYAVFHRYAAMALWETDVHAGDLADIDGILVLDTCAYSQLDPIADWLRAATVPKIAVDHHVTRDELADDYVIDETAAATCLILYEWACALHWVRTAETNEALFVGMAMDTGWFRHSNTDERVLGAAAELVRGGVRPHELYQALFQSESPARVRLLAEALRTLELTAEDRLAVMTLSSEARGRAGAAAGDTEEIVDQPLRIDSVRVSVLLVEQDNGVIRASFRSKAPVDDPHAVRDRQEGRTNALDVDVARVAQACGGGGHSRAAGAKMKGTLAEARNRVVTHLQHVLADAGAGHA